MADIYKAGGILIRDRKFLVERSKNKTVFIAPGGSIESNETPKEALVRELKEEFKISTIEEDFEEFGVFTARAAEQEDKIVVMNVFLVKKWIGEITPDNEVQEVMWINSNLSKGLKLGSIFEHEVLPRLKSLDLID
jgi:ADP-ribose pyrophosphatase YjhB (NUDIX family)